MRFSEFLWTDCPHICKTRQNVGVHIEAIQIEYPDVAYVATYTPQMLLKSIFIYTIKADCNKGCRSKTVYFQRIARIWRYTDWLLHPLICCQRWKWLMMSINIKWKLNTNNRGFHLYCDCGYSSSNRRYVLNQHFESTQVNDLNS